MVEFTFKEQTPAAAEDVLAAARDFSERRIEVWPNVSARRYEVHAIGQTFAEVTETALQGLFWERSRYEWDESGRVRQTVLDSNALLPGSSWELCATANGAGCEVEVVFRREFKRTAKGRFAWIVNRYINAVYGSDMRRMLRTVERGR